MERRRNWVLPNDSEVNPQLKIEVKGEYIPGGKSVE
jgi:hypothetical protein